MKKINNNEFYVQESWITNVVRQCKRECPGCGVLVVEVKTSQLVSHNGHPGGYNHGAQKEFCS